MAAGTTKEGAGKVVKKAEREKRPAGKKESVIKNGVFARQCTIFALLHHGSGRANFIFRSKYYR